MTGTKNYFKVYYQRNKDSIKGRTKSRRKQRHEWYDNILKTKHCEICGPDPDFPWEILQCHHVDATTKKFGIVAAVNGGYHSLEEIEEEMKKCIFLCPNHHAIETLKQRKSGEIKTGKKIESNEIQNEGGLFG